MRSAGNFHPEWGYLAPAPSFMRTLRIALVATAIGATAGAAVVVTLVGRPSSHAGTSSIAAHTLVTSVQSRPVQPAAVVPVVAAKPAAAEPANAPGIQAASTQVPAAMAPASAVPPDAAPAALASMPGGNHPASAAPGLANLAPPAPSPAPAKVVALTDPPPPAAADPLPIREEAMPEHAPAKKTVKRRHGGNYEAARHWQQPLNDEARRRWSDDGGLGPLLHLFSSRTSTAYSPN